MKKLHGVIPAIGTPLTSGDCVDEPALRRLTRYLLDAGVHGILANGSMGGFAWLPAAEQLRAIAIIAGEVSGAVPVLGGLGETGTVRAVQMAREIARLGVSHLSILPPYYYFATQQHLISWFCGIAEAVDIPVVAYDNPALTKNKIQPATLAGLLRAIPGLVGLKESDNDMVQLQEILHLCREFSGFAVFSGHEWFLHESLRMGCAGGVGGLYNICPHAAVALYDAFQAGRQEEAARLQRDLIDVWQIFRCGDIWGGFDEALRALGLAERATAAPYTTQLTAGESARVRGIVNQYSARYTRISR